MSDEVNSFGAMVATLASDPVADVQTEFAVEIRKTVTYRPLGKTLRMVEALQRAGRPMSALELSAVAGIRKKAPPPIPAPVQAAQMALWRSE